jgi:hypothetical protein
VKDRAWVKNNRKLYGWKEEKVNNREERMCSSVVECCHSVECVVGWNTCITIQPDSSAYPSSFCV